MRKDMAKVIVERPRKIDGWETPKGRIANRGKGHQDYEDLPYREGMKKQKGGTKILNENLAPLQRFIQSRVGLPWNQVYSEICENLKTNTAVQKHVRDHVGWMVTTKTFIGADGKLYGCGSNGSEHVIGESSWYPDFFVDPKGILRFQKKRSRSEWRKKREDDVLARRRDGPDGLTQYHKLSGIWYEVKLSSFTLTEKVYPQTASFPSGKTLVAFDPYGREHSMFPAIITLSPIYVDKSVEREVFKLYGRKDVFAVNKKQLSSKELKKAGLING